MSDFLSTVNLLASLGVILATVAVILALLQLLHMRHEDKKQKEQYRSVFIKVIQRDLVWLVGGTREFQRSIFIKCEQRSRDAVRQRGFVDGVNYSIKPLEIPTILSLLSTFPSLPGDFAQEVGSLVSQVSTYNQRLEVVRDRELGHEFQNVRDLLILSYCIEQFAKRYLDSDYGLPAPLDKTRMMSSFDGFTKTYHMLDGQ